MKDWDDLHTVLALGRSGTLKGAAETLDVSETTVSRRLKRFTGERMAALFARNGQNWVPTQLGERLIAIGERVERQMEWAAVALEEVDGAPGGRLRVEGPPFVNRHFICPSLARLKAAHPKLSVEIKSLITPTDPADRLSDVVLRLSRPETGRLIGRRIAYAPLIALAPAPGETGWVGVAGASPDSVYWNAATQHFGAEPTLTVDGFDCVLAIAQATGFGAAAPTCILKHSPINRPKTPLREMELWAVYHQDMRESAKVRAFIDHLALTFPSANRCLCGSCLR